MAMSIEATVETLLALQDATDDPLESERIGLIIALLEDDTGLEQHEITERLEELHRFGGMTERPTYLC